MTNIVPGAPRQDDDNELFGDEATKPASSPRSSRAIFPPSSPATASYVPSSISQPPVPDFERKIAAVSRSTRTWLEERGFKPNTLPENTIICSTRIDWLLQNPLSSTLPPAIRNRWKNDKVHPREFPLLRRAMAVADITFIGDIPDLDHRQFIQTLTEYGFEEDILDVILEFLDSIYRRLGITFGVPIGKSERKHFELLKDLATEECDAPPLGVLLSPLSTLLQKIKPAKIRDIVKYKLEEIGCTLIGDFVELSGRDLDNCDLNDVYAPMITTMVEGIEKLGLRMGMKLTSETKKAIQRHKAMRT